MTRVPAPTLALLGLAITAGCAAGCNGNSDVADAPTGPSAPVTRGGVEYSADTRVMESFPVQLDTRVTMRNPSSQATRVQLGSGCPVLIRAYRNEARTQLAWDQSIGMVCTQQIQVVDLAPGASAERAAPRVNARDILGDSLPDGRYYLSAFVQVVGSPLTLPAGSADLGIPR
jgi:hypothetical protein